MDVLTSETCWTLNDEIIKQVTSSWSLFTQLSRNKFTTSTLYSTIATPSNFIRCTYVPYSSWYIEYQIWVSSTTDVEISFIIWIICPESLSNALQSYSTQNVLNYSWAWSRDTKGALRNKIRLLKLENTDEMKLMMTMIIKWCDNVLCPLLRWTLRWAKPRPKNCSCLEEKINNF